ncbi:hypothetical protein [Aestuariivirga sp.]|uniref:hypothetical protein n=1 Tax=Aestuariivirga sp. TaxID=2650926 RepID=UPI0039E391EA
MAEWAGHELVPLGTFTSPDPRVHPAPTIQQAGDVTGSKLGALVEGMNSAAAEPRTLKRDDNEAIAAFKASPLNSKACHTYCDGQIRSTI